MTRLAEKMQEYVKKIFIQGLQRMRASSSHNGVAKGHD